MNNDRVAMEGILYEIREISDCLFLLRRSIPPEDCPELEGSLGLLGDLLRKKTDDCISILFGEKKEAAP